MKKNDGPLLKKWNSNSKECRATSTAGKTTAKQLRQRLRCMNIPPQPQNKYSTSYSTMMIATFKICPMTNNTHLTKADVSEGGLNDETMPFLFRGLTNSETLEQLSLSYNCFTSAGVRSMVPFLQNASNLTHLDLSRNEIYSEGFNMLFRALRDSPIQTLDCDECGIESIDVFQHRAYSY